MAEYITRIRTESGDKQIDYNALANLPTTDTTLTKSKQAADAKATGDAISNLDSKKLDKAGGTMTAAINMGNKKITNLGTPTENTDAANKKYVDDTAGKNLPKAGGTMSGNIAMNSNKITGLGTPTSDYEAANKKYVDDTAGKNLPKAGGTMTGAINMGSNKITNLATPTASTDAVNKSYVDSKKAVFTGTIPANAWTVHPGESGGYYQAVGVSGIKTTDTVGFVSLNNDDLDTTGTSIVKVQQRDEAWSYLYRCVIMANGSVRFYSYELLDIDLPFRITVLR